MIVYKAQILQSMHPRAVYYLWLRHKNLREIAHCMHIIALAGLHKLNNKSGQKYYHLFFIKELFKGNKLTSISDIVSSNELHTRYNDTESLTISMDRFLIIYITSDKSCSGLINSGIYRILNFFVELINLKYKSVRLISIGKKGFTTFRRRFRFKFYKVFLELDSEKNSFSVCSVIVSKFMKLAFDKGVILFNRYVNSHTHFVSYYSFFSFSFLMTKISYDQFSNKLFKRLNSMNIVDDYSLRDLYRFSMSILLLDSLKENFFSEIAARARVMENIMQSLDVLINMFWINYQKTRQRRITDEIIEILNGANVANEYSIDARNEAIAKANAEAKAEANVEEQAIFETSHDHAYHHVTVNSDSSVELSLFDSIWNTLNIEDTIFVSNNAFNVNSDLDDGDSSEDYLYYWNYVDNVFDYANAETDLSLFFSDDEDDEDDEDDVSNSDDEDGLYNSDLNIDRINSDNCELSASDFLTLSEISLLTLDEYTRLSNIKVVVDYTFSYDSDLYTPLSFFDICTLLENNNEHLISEYLRLSGFTIDRTYFSANEVIDYLLMEENMFLFPDIILFQNAYDCFEDEEDELAIFYEN